MRQKTRFYDVASQGNVWPQPWAWVSIPQSLQECHSYWALLITMFVGRIIVLIAPKTDANIQYVPASC